MCKSAYETVNEVNKYNCALNHVMPYCCVSSSIEDECVELTAREYTVLRIICDRREPLSFSSIKNKSNLHQEIVSRILKRLKVYGLLETHDGKYVCCKDCLVNK